MLRTQSSGAILSFSTWIGEGWVHGRAVKHCSVLSLAVMMGEQMDGGSFPLESPLPLLPLGARTHPSWPRSSGALPATWSQSDQGSIEWIFKPKIDFPFFKKAIHWLLWWLLRDFLFVLYFSSQTAKHMLDLLICSFIFHNKCKSHLCSSIVWKRFFFHKTQLNVFQQMEFFPSMCASRKRCAFNLWCASR